ncbi:MAG: hypothetical protein K6V97_14855 [Actinomycetia bacterium]|nr:hypothetical protein [Actinomycetes bacterium]
MTLVESGTPTLGGTVTLSASATDPAGTPLYDFWVESPDGRWSQPLGGYTSTPTLTLDLPAAGSYVVDCYALDQTQVAQRAWGEAALAQQVVWAGVKPTVSVTAPGQPTVGTPLSVTTTAAGVPDPRYDVWIQHPDGTWQDLTGYQSTPSVTYTPQHPGPHTFAVYVAPGAALVPWKAAVAATATVTVTATPTVTLSGTVQNGQIRFPVVVWQYVGGRWNAVDGDAMIDTGNSAGLVVNGSVLGASGDVSQGSATVVGVGGPSSVGLWPGLYVAPQSDPTAWIAANTTGIGGLEGLGDPTLVVNIGLPSLQAGVFALNGSTWTWTYPVAAAGAGGPP